MSIAHTFLNKDGRWASYVSCTFSILVVGAPHGAPPRRSGAAQSTSQFWCPYSVNLCDLGHTFSYQHDFLSQITKTALAHVSDWFSRIYNLTKLVYNNAYQKTSRTIEFGWLKYKRLIQWFHEFNLNARLKRCLNKLAHIELVVYTNKRNTHTWQANGGQQLGLNYYGRWNSRFDVLHQQRRCSCNPAQREQLLGCFYIDLEWADNRTLSVIRWKSWSMNVHTR
jgi:hypothetical protein